MAWTFTATYIPTCWGIVAYAVVRVGLRVAKRDRSAADASESSEAWSSDRGTLAAAD
jgi:hypothetical protein